VFEEFNLCRATYGVRDEPGNLIQAWASKRRVAVRFVPKQARRCQPRQGQAASRSECSFEPTLALDRVEQTSRCHRSLSFAPLPCDWAPDCWLCSAPPTPRSKTAASPAAASATTAQTTAVISKAWAKA